MVLTKRKIKAFMKEEKQASAEYRKLGFPKLSRDEARHSKFFKKMLQGGKK